MLVRERHVHQHLHRRRHASAFRQHEARQKAANNRWEEARRGTSAATEEITKSALHAARLDAGGWRSSKTGRGDALERKRGKPRWWRDRSRTQVRSSHRASQQGGQRGYASRRGGHREDRGRADAQVRLRGGGDPPGAARSGGRSRRRRSGGSTSTTPATRSGWILRELFRGLAKHTPVPRRRRATGATGTPTATSWASRPRLPRPSLHHRPALVLLEHRAAVPADYDGSGARCTSPASRKSIARTGTPWPDGQKLRRCLLPVRGSQRHREGGRPPALAEGLSRELRRRLPADGVRTVADCATRRSGKLAPTTPRPPTGCRSLSAPARRWWRSSCRAVPQPPSSSADQGGASRARGSGGRGSQAQGRQPQYRPPKRDRDAMGRRSRRPFRQPRQVVRRCRRPEEGTG